MTQADPQTITRLLQSVRAGSAGAVEELLPFVYSELQQLARGHFAGERSGHTLQPTALLHEAWLKLVGHLDRVDDRKHFFIIASRAMRQVLADHARGAKRQKRGDGRKRVTLDVPGQRAAEGFDLVDLHDTLDRLAKLNERHARVVELRLLGGLTIADTADALGVSHTTIEGDWFTAKAWLRTQLALVG